MKERVLYLGNKDFFSAQKTVEYGYADLTPDFSSEGWDRIEMADFDIRVMASCIRRNLRNVTVRIKDIPISFGEYGKLRALEEKALRSHNYNDLKKLNLLHCVYEILDGHTKLDCYPSHLQLEHTTYCNARCIMCDHYIAHNRGASHLTTEKVRYLEPIFPYLQEIIMHGNGEPLLNPQIKDFFDLYRKYGIRVSFNTNLSVLTSDLISCIKENCDTLHISCDGCTKEQYEGIRQGLNFDIFCRNLSNLRKGAPNVHLIMEVVLMKQNINDAIGFIKLADRYGINEVVFSKVCANGIIHNDVDSLDDCGFEAGDSCSRAAIYGKTHNIIVRSPYPLGYSDNKSKIEHRGFPEEDISYIYHEMYPDYTNTIAFRNLSESEITPFGKPFGTVNGVCEYPFAKVYIDLNGNVSTCCPMSRRIIGRISKEKPFEKVWNCENYQKVRKYFLNGNLPGFCSQSCHYWSNNSLLFLDCEGIYGF